MSTESDIGHTHNPRAGAQRDRADARGTATRLSVPLRAAIALSLLLGALAALPRPLDAQTPLPPTPAATPGPGDPPKVEIVATPVPVPRPTAVPSGDPLVRVVGVGETLSSLAAQSGFSISDLAKRNLLTRSNALLTGQRVRLPARISPRIRLHRVAPGETVTSLAAGYDISPYQLRQANNLPCATCLVVNQLLRIPLPASAPATDSNLPQPFDRVDVIPAQPAPGDIVVVRVLPSQPLDTVIGTFADHPLRFVRRGDYWEALSGVSALTDAGVYGVSVRAAATSGAAAEVSGRIQVVQSGYGSENITIDYRLAPLLDPQVNAEERFEIDTLVSQFTPNAYYSGTFRLPVVSKITSYFGARRSFNDGLLRTYHSGTDMLAPVGTPVHVAAAGRVAAVTTLKVRGQVVVIDHGRGIFTLYCHLSRVDVKQGQIVNAGDVIALSGNTGRSEGPHLHWELAVGGVTVDPLPYTETPLP
ncbi:MAG: peptidoglycan DD-metalloendopeptidase family protein [Thermoflexales bacterium]|nr:peptidoglycan DD-metalloendopeptidase family protein [Thermoflexales bacterium]